MTCKLQPCFPTLFPPPWTDVRRWMVETKGLSGPLASGGGHLSQPPD